MTTVRVLIAGLLGALCLALSACGSVGAGGAGSDSTPAPRTVTVTHTAAASPGATSSAATGETTPTTSTSATSTAASTSSSAAAECVAADLSLSFLGGRGATGHGELGFALANTSSRPCETGGYPGVLLLDGSGRGLRTEPQHTTDDFFGHVALRRLTVAPGDLVSFRLGVSHVGSGGSEAGCTSAKGLQVIAPNDTATMRLDLPGGIAECGGTVTVSPVAPGHSALS